MYVILWENSVRFITSLKRCGNVCVCVWGGGGGGGLKDFGSLDLAKT